eukprot:scaffold18_cov401-Prasinococcus_capsulatus_cf.AAC.1
MQGKGTSEYGVGERLSREGVRLRVEGCHISASRSPPRHGHHAPAAGRPESAPSEPVLGLSAPLRGAHGGVEVAWAQASAPRRPAAFIGVRGAY